MTQREPDFDRIARMYRWAEYLTLGPLLQRIRVHHLGVLLQSRQAFILGDGDGRFLARLLERNPRLHATAVDTSAAMLKLLRNRCDFADDRLRTKQASALSVDAPPNTDLVVTHFLLDCFTQPEVDALVQRMSAQLAPGALWLVSDFAIPPKPLLRTVAGLYIRSLYFAFRVLTGLRTTRLPNPQSALTQAGFARTARQERLFGLVYTEVWQLRRNEL
jgi:ubiquinone/menaquinone biosynthesis C-methylase UbiE